MDIIKDNIVNSQYLELDVLDNLNEESMYKKLSAAVGKVQIFEGFCTKCSSEGDLSIKCGDVTCIMPRSEVTPVTETDGLVHKSTCQNKVGKNLKFKVISKDSDKFYVSRKSLIENVRKEYNTNLKVGQIVRGIITNIEESIGCFVDIGGEYTAVLPKRCLEYVFVNNITDHVQIGDVVEGKITVLEKEDNDIKTIIISRIDTLPPYEELIKEYSPGDVVIGIVNQITSQSIFAQLTKHLNIACRLTPNMKVKVGQKVRIKIKRVGNSVNKRLVGDIISSL
ncbi:MAG: S1 RNA-binding domain-containing protein [Clostridium celatum]|uniref:S1 RNA-binding domain-containing protein n=1 Tax=Clostridium tertium TaxID=1559 RepID=UPI0029008033|nr:S1 RNA-binding domain-containing protein [Clostridium celatum]